MGKLIVITGLDGSGTTTIAKKLAELDKNSFFIQSPDTFYSSCRNYIDTKVKEISEIAHYYFYLSNNIFISEKIKMLKEDFPDHNIYCTRYLIDTVVSHSVQGLNIDLVYKNELYDILKPDFTFFLKLDEIYRQKRLNNREEKSTLDRVLDNESIRNKFLERFSLYEELIYIDASKSIEDICKDINFRINGGIVL